MWSGLFLALPRSDRAGRFGKGSQRFVGCESAFFRAELFPCKKPSVCSPFGLNPQGFKLLVGVRGGNGTVCSPLSSRGDAQPVPLGLEELLGSWASEQPAGMLPWWCNLLRAALRSCAEPSSRQLAGFGRS